MYIFICGPTTKKTCWKILVSRVSEGKCKHVREAMELDPLCGERRSPGVRLPRGSRVGWVAEKASGWVGVDDSRQVGVDTQQVGALMLALEYPCWREVTLPQRCLSGNLSCPELPEQCQEFRLWVPSGCPSGNLVRVPLFKTLSPALPFWGPLWT